MCRCIQSYCSVTTNLNLLPVLITPSDFTVVASLLTSQNHQHSSSAPHILFFIVFLLCVRVFSVCTRLCPSTAVISAHPIHSLDNHHHHYHMGSLASPTRSYLYHQGGSHVRAHTCATPISHLDRVDSSGRETPAGQIESGHSSVHSSAHNAAVIIHVMLYFSKPAHLFCYFLSMFLFSLA